MLITEKKISSMKTLVLEICIICIEDTHTNFK